MDIFSPEFRLKFAERQSAPISAVPTPLQLWNDCCQGDGGGVGLADGWMVILGGNPKFGKTMIALDMLRVAMMSGRRPGFISLEMNTFTAASRIMAMITNTPVWKLEKRGYSERQFTEVWKTIAPAENDFGLYVDDRVHYGIDSIMQSMESLLANGYNYFVVDYLQLAAIGSEESINRAVVEVTSRLRAFAKDNNVPVLALSQFNRETSKNYVDTPQPQGCHGGMIVEASGDQIILIDHSRYEKTLKGARTWLELTNRHGPSASIPIEWYWEGLRLRQADDDQHDQWPTNAKTEAGR